MDNIRKFKPNEKTCAVCKDKKPFLLMQDVPLCGDCAIGIFKDEYDKENEWAVEITRRGVEHRKAQAQNRYHRYDEF